MNIQCTFYDYDFTGHSINLIENELFYLTPEAGDLVISLALEKAFTILNDVFSKHHLC